MNCQICNKQLTGMQTKYCSGKCKNQSTNKKFQSYKAAQKRGWSRKDKLIEMKGGSCKMCGYNKNSAALSFHHLNPETKSFGIDIRQCSNRSWDVLVEEVNKCILVCLNCHMEIEHPDHFVGPVGLEPTTRTL